MKTPGAEPIDRRVIPPPIKNVIRAERTDSDRRTGTIILDYGPQLIKQLGKISLEAITDDVETLIARLNVRLEESNEESKDDKAEALGEKISASGARVGKRRTKKLT